MDNATYFKKNGYVIIKSAISSEIRDFVTQYALFDEMQNYATQDIQVPNAHSVYADPAMETVLVNLQNTIEKNIELSVYPTYSYYRVYRNGDELTSHIDRPSCEISCTLCFNYEYTDKNYNWPIFMDGDPVILEPGDMAIYRGCDIRHWRDPFIGQEKDWQIQGFFHYVDVNGPYSDFKFDKRPTLGVKKQKEKIIIMPNKPYISVVE